ncbi:hypothetical protein WH96_02760 [Kiloniella spongiae]|uniref:Uncharacterized protein n=1 Tax=Kiloniella spongiae TaxID=1489064 RepID=A0A0H2N0N2_9PROT|nr:hypothetical protein WH96_02760 [Kiloniella spongiae]
MVLPALWSSDIMPAGLLAHGSLLNYQTFPAPNLSILPVVIIGKNSPFTVAGAATVQNPLMGRSFRVPF